MSGSGLGTNGCGITVIFSSDVRKSCFENTINDALRVSRIRLVRTTSWGELL